MQELKAEILKEIKSLDWSNEKDQICRLVKPSIIVKTARASNIKTGRSKFGGKPDLMESVPWPFKNQRPMAFLGQINFTDIEHQEIIPTELKNKLISFFICVNQVDYKELNPKIHETIICDSGSFDFLEPRGFPVELDNKYHFDQKELTYSNSFSIPSYQHWSILELDLNAHDEFLYSEDLYEIFNQKFNLNHEPGHQLFGYSDAIQGDTNQNWAAKYSNQVTGPDSLKSPNLERRFNQLIQINLREDFSNISDGCAYFGYTSIDNDKIHIECELQNT